MTRKPISKPAEEATEVAVITPQNAVTVLTDPAKFDAFYQRIKAEADSHVPDLTSETGRKAIASLAYKVARTKTAIDAEGKRLTEEWRANVSKVDAARKVIRDRLDALKDEVRAPLTKWEEDEAERVADVNNIMADIRHAAEVSIFDTAADVADRIEHIRGMPIDEAKFQSHYAIAIGSRDHTIAALESAHVRLIREEADRAELERLRAAEIERQERERASAENEAMLRAAMAGVRAIADYVTEECVRAERAATERAEAIAKAEREAAEAATQAAEKAAADALAAQQRAADEALAAEKKRADDAEAAHAEEAKKIADAKAIQDAEAKRIADEQAARDADRKHRGEVMRAAKQAIMLVGVSEEAAKKIVLAIVANEIPNITLRF